MNFKNHYKTIGFFKANLHHRWFLIGIRSISAHIIEMRAATSALESRLQDQDQETLGMRNNEGRYAMNSY